MPRTAATPDPDDADRPLALRCGCGRRHAATEHGAFTEAAPAAPADAPITRARLEATLVRALFPNERLRRRFLQAVGAGTARAAIASLLPFGALEAMAQDKGRSRRRTSRSASSRSPARRR